MAQLRVHVDHLGVEKLEIVPEGGGFSPEVFELTGSLGHTLLALDQAIRGHFLGTPQGRPTDRERRKQAGPPPASAGESGVGTG